MAPPKIRLRGLRSPKIPPGYILGRMPGVGSGEAQLLNIRQLQAGFGVATKADAAQGGGGGGGGGGTGFDYFCDPTITKAPPASGLLTAAFSTNSSAGVMTVSADRTTLDIPSASSGVQAAYASVPYPGADFTLTVQVLLHAKEWNNGTQTFGIAGQDTTNKLFQMGFIDKNNSFDAGGSTEHMTVAYPDINSNPGGVGFSWWWGPSWSGVPMWMRYQQSGSNFIFSVSQDGVNWRVLTTIASSNLGTMSKIGVLFSNSASTQPDAAFTIFSWKLTTP